jgi:hypothetical protein
MAKSKPAPKPKAKPKPVTKRPATPAAHATPASTENGAAVETAIAKPEARRMLPTKGELKSLYLRYTDNAAFDDHDKAFYFVLDVGGVSRARQLLAHVEEVLAELEEFQRSSLLVIALSASITAWS